MRRTHAHGVALEGTCWMNREGKPCAEVVEFSTYFPFLVHSTSTLQYNPLSMDSSDWVNIFLVWVYSWGWSHDECTVNIYDCSIKWRLTSIYISYVSVCPSVTASPAATVGPRTLIFCMDIFCTIIFSMILTMRKPMWQQAYCDSKASKEILLQSDMRFVVLTSSHFLKAILCNWLDQLLIWSLTN